MDGRPPTRGRAACFVDYVRAAGGADQIRNGVA
jgi:hypothetical protein